MKNDDSARPRQTQQPARLTKADFVNGLNRMLATAAQAGKNNLELRAAALHTEVGNYPSRGHSIPTCCTVMLEAMQSGDEVLLQPAGGKGPSLLIRYRLPR